MKVAKSRWVLRAALPAFSTGDRRKSTDGAGWDWRLRLFFY